MQVSVESTGKLERRMQVAVPAERVAQEIAARLKTLSRTARLKGFRPGKAPLTVIRRQFGVKVHREVIGELLQSSFTEAVTQKQLAPAGNPRIEPHSIAEGQDLKYTATFEVFPDIALQPIESLDIERTTAAVTDADVDAMIERLRKQQMQYHTVTRAAGNGDRVTIDFDGTIDGKAFAGGTGENVGIILGEGKMLAEFERGLLGGGAGDQRAIDVSFPADYRVNELAGKAAVFNVQIRGVEAAVVPELNEEFCELFGVTDGGVAKLREEVSANMRRELEQTLRNRNKSTVLEKLYQANPIDVPNSLIDSQVRDMQVEAMRRAGIKDAAQAPSPQPFIEPARRRAAVGLILGELIKRQNLRPDAARADARLDEIVGAYGDAAALKRTYQQNAGAMRQVESLALEDQAVDWVLAHAQVREVASTFRELMKFEG